MRVRARTHPSVLHPSSPSSPPPLRLSSPVPSLLHTDDEQGRRCRWQQHDARAVQASPACSSLGRGLPRPALRPVHGPSPLRFPLFSPSPSCVACLRCVFKRLPLSHLRHRSSCALAAACLLNLCTQSGHPYCLHRNRHLSQGHESERASEREGREAGRHACARFASCKQSVKACSAFLRRGPHVRCSLGLYLGMSVNVCSYLST